MGDQLSKPTVLILAGGFGTRLQSVLGGVPKPLAPVEDQAGNTRPFLYFLLQSLKKQGYLNIVLSLFHEANQFRELQVPGLNVRIVVEPQPLGTGGAILYAIQNLAIEGDVLVMNGDTWLGSDFERIHPETLKPMKIALCEVRDSSRYGSVECDNLGRVIQFKEKSTTPVKNPGWINAGVYGFQALKYAEICGILNKTGAFSIERDIFPELVKRRGLFGSPYVKTEHRFIDIGIPSDYEQFKLQVREGGIQ